MNYKIDRDDPQDKINQEFLVACSNGDLEQVRHLLTSPILNFRANIHYQDDDGLTRACEHGHIHIVKYLLSSPELKEHIDFTSYNYLGFVIACENNNVDLVKYFISGLPFFRKIDVEAYSGFAFLAIGKRGHLDLVRYLFSESPVRNDINEESWTICFYAAAKAKNYHIVQYFIFELNYSEAKILEFLNKHPDDEISHLLEKRKLRQKLYSNLSQKDEDDESGVVKV